MFWVIHNSFDVVTKYLIISTETCKIILLGWLCWDEQCIFSHDLLFAKILKTAATEPYTYIDHANIISQFVRNITKAKQKDTYIETIDHDKLSETWIAEILYNKIYCGKCIFIKTSINGVIQNKMFSGKFIMGNLSVHGFILPMLCPNLL